MSHLNMVMNDTFNHDQELAPNLIIEKNTEQWIKNPNFTSPIDPPWYSVTGGDGSDIDAIGGGGQANVTIIGNSGVMSIVADPPNASNWTPFQNPAFPVLPDTFGIDGNGCYATHTWDESVNQTENTPSIQWKHNVTMPVNMSDYEITSASLTATVSGEADGDVECPGDYQEAAAVYDYVRFYVKIADIDGSDSYELAYNQTVYFGQGDEPPDINSYLGNTAMITLPEEFLIFYLTAVLSEDYYNFTIILGIDIYCEDNIVGADVDTWNELRISQFNLTFTYEKKINRETFASWNQLGNSLPQGNVQVDEARLYLKYKTDQNWSTVDSPNSELRFYINNISHSETVKLTNANTSFEDAKPGGFDITTLIPKSANISISIQVYLADNFLLSHNITLSITDVYLWINYTTYYFEPTLNVIANTTYLYTNEWSQLTVTCENSSNDNVDWLGYYDPFLSTNVTLDTNFTGLRTYYLNFTSSSPGPRTFKFYANTTTGVWAYDDITIVWVTAVAPTLSVTTNASTLFANQWAQLTVYCENGSGVVDTLWYYDPFLTTNVTLAENFTGAVVKLLNFTSSSPGSYHFEFWANSSYNKWAYDDLTIIWEPPLPPSLSVTANVTDPYNNQWTQLTLTAQSGTGNISVLWFENPFTSNNETIDSNFAGIRTYYLNFSSSTAGPRTFKFWANSTLKAETYKEFLVVWVDPTAPILTVNTNTSDPYVNEWIELTLTCQSGTGNVSVLWYNDPMDGLNKTIATNFAGSQTHYLYFTNATAGSRLFRFWANSTVESDIYKDTTVIWIAPQAPILNIIANKTDPFINEWVDLTVSCVGIDGNTSIWWYHNPLDGQNHTLDTNFAGTEVLNLYFTNDTAGSYMFQFWATSSFGITTYRDLTIVWKQPTPPTVNVVANTTSLYTTYWVQLTVSCQSGSEDISMLYYRNPFDSLNYSLDTNFAGLHVHVLNFTSASAGSYEFRFWANSSSGLLEDYYFITIVWFDPTSPSLSVVANITDPYINEWTQLTVTCQSGSGNVSSLWYYSPMDNANHTLATNFAGSSIHTLDFVNDTAGTYHFDFWAISALGILVHDYITIIWVTPTPPILSVDVNWTLLDINLWTQLTVTCQSGSTNISTLWYNNPFDGINYSLAENYAGSVIKYLNFTSASPGSFKFMFWANSTRGIEVYRDITVVWVNPTAPSLDVVANVTILTITYWTEIRVTCQSGSGNVDTLWYNDPFDGQNKTLDSYFTGLRVKLLNYTDTSAGARTFYFWANSTLGMEVFDLITIVWTLPTAPSLSVTTNASSLYTTQIAQLTVSCQSGSDNVDTLWYNDPFDGQNKTLATAFSGLQVFLLNFTSLSPVSHTFRFWANATLGMNDYDFVIVVWVAPLPPSLSVIANNSNPYADEWAQLTISCQKGSINVSHLFYNNPFDGQNYTLATDFISHVSLLDFTSSNSGAFEFKVWANDTLGFIAYESVIIVWITTVSPTVSVLANVTDPYTDNGVRLTIVCQRGSENVSVLWYENPFDNQNYTLATDFSDQTLNLDFISASSGSYTFKFFANSTVGADAYDSVIIVWITPVSPSINLIANLTNPLINHWIYLRIDCQRGSENVSSLYYQNPFDNQTHILATNFAVYSVFLNFTSAIANSFEFKFWANSTVGVTAYETISIVWVQPPIPSLTVDANTTALDTNEWVLITITCEISTGFIQQLWLQDPFTGRNLTLGINFAGQRVISLPYINKTAGTYTFKVYALSDLGVEVYDSVSVTWVTPSGPGPGFGWITWVLLGALAVVLGIMAAWQLYFKVPKTVRIIRKTKGNIKKGTVENPVKVEPREATAYDMMIKKIKTAGLGKELPQKPEAPGIKVTKKSVSK